MGRTHTFSMNGGVRGIGARGLMLLALMALCARAGRADEIRLKDGKKLYGVIVAYEDNMFKVKTDFGYVLVEKDKIAAIIPDSPGQPSTEKSGSSAKANASSEPASAPVEPAKKPAVNVTNANARPAIPTASKSATDLSAPKLKATAAAAPPLSVATPPPAAPKELPPEKREEITGNTYTNHEFGFRMYKAPSWELIDGAGQTLPNAIVAMGTANQSTLMIIGHEKSRDSLEATAESVEKRLQDAYENYRVISHRKSVIGGQPAVEYQYSGVADAHDWSGTLSVVRHGGEYLTILGMTFAETDLIQIQQNVIARATSSLDFNVQ